MIDVTAHLSKNRIDLVHEIPLSQPTKVCIDPSDVCNFQCDFCGLHSKRSDYCGVVMEKEIFELVLKQVLEFDSPIKQIHLYALGEPLINRNLPLYIKELKRTNAANEVIVVSNGSLLTKNISEELVSSGLDELRISINGLTDEDYYRITGKNVSFDSLFDNIDYYNSIGGKIHVKILGDYFTDEEKAKFIEIFRGHCFSFNISNTIQNMENQEFDVQITGKNQHGLLFNTENRMVCPQIFYELVVHSNGDIGPCSADYNFFTDRLGNVKNTTLKKVWNSERLMKMRLAALKGESMKYGNCDCCTFPQNGASVNLTPYRIEILKRIKNTNSF